MRPLSSPELGGRGRTLDSMATRYRARAVGKTRGRHAEERFDLISALTSGRKKVYWQSPKMRAKHGTGPMPVGAAIERELSQLKFRQSDSIWRAFTRTKKARKPGRRRGR